MGTIVVRQKTPAAFIAALLTPVILSVVLWSPLTCAAQNALDVFVDGVEAFEIQEYQEAVASFQKAIELDPSNLEFQYFLGLAYARLSRDQEAMEIFESVHRKDPVNYRKAFYDIAAIFSKQKNYQKALDTLGLVEKADPKETRVHMEKGAVYRRLGDFDSAVKSYLRAAELEPKNTQAAYLNIAITHLEADRFDQSKSWLSKTIAVDPDTVIAESARGAMPAVEATRRARKPWYLTASLGWGYDDSIPTNPLSEQVGPVTTTRFTDEGDQYQTFLFRGGYKFINRRDLEAGAGYLLITTGYKDAVDNNILGHIPHLYFQLHEEPYFFRIQYDFSYYSVGGSEDIQDSGFYLTFGKDSRRMLRMNSLMPTLSISQSNNMRSDLILLVQKKEYFDDQTPDAWSTSLGIIQSYRFPNTDYTARGGYKYTEEEADVETYSYRSHEGLLGLGFPLIRGIWGDASVTYIRTSLDNIHHHINRARVYSISLYKTFFGHLHCNLSYHYTRNKSNLTINPNNFTRNVYEVMLTYEF